MNAKERKETILGLVRDVASQFAAQEEVREAVYANELGLNQLGIWELTREFGETLALELPPKGKHAGPDEDTQVIEGIIVG